MFVMLLLIALFIALVVHEEYADFDREAAQIRKRYIQKQKESIVFDTERVLGFIRHAYRSHRDVTDEDKLKNQVIDAIEHLYGRQDGTGYIFIYSDKGVKLSDPVQTQDIGKNLYDYRDVDGVQVIKALIDNSKKGGGFVSYQWMKPTTGELSPKISYARYFEPWGWMVGTGVYLDEVEKLIGSERTALKERLIKYLMEILSLAVILTGLGFILVVIINRIIAREINTFSQFFKDASRSYREIDTDQVHLGEFKKMVKYSNRMVSEIHKRKNRLKKANLSLEKKVAEKTEDLREQNRLLEEEKRFSESVVQAQESFIKHSIHEINTPLAVIMTHIDIYKMKYGENRYLGKIEAASKIIATIYDDLSYMVKKDRQIYEKERIDFSSYLAERIDFFDEVAAGNRHRIIARIEERIRIRFSVTELQRIIDNNLSNAVKYAKKDTDILVSLVHEGSDIVLRFETASKRIADTKRIFEAFHREEDGMTGMGLGLEIVGSICRKEGVEIDVLSDDERTLFSYRFKQEERG